MIATFSFNLPEEQEEHNDALRGGSYHAVIQDFDNWLRNAIKYEDKNEIKTQEVRDKLWEAMKEHDLSVW